MSVHRARAGDLATRALATGVRAGVRTPGTAGDQVDLEARAATSLSARSGPARRRRLMADPLQWWRPMNPGHTARGRILHGLADAGASPTRAPLSQLERLAFVGLVGQLVFTLFIVPAPPRGRLGEPIYVAVVSSSALTIALIGMRLRARRDPRLERLLLALFLGAMPVIYTATALGNGDSGRVLGAQVVAIVGFGVVAVLGFVRSPWFLAAGIAAHGLGWDASHHAEHLVVPGWYSIFCLVVDVVLAGYVATQVRAYAVDGGRPDRAPVSV